MLSAKRPSPLPYEAIQAMQPDISAERLNQFDIQSVFDASPAPPLRILRPCGNWISRSSAPLRVPA